MSIRTIAGLTALLAALAVATSHAAVRGKTVEYNVDGETYSGYIAWDDAIEGERPGILVVHEWWGHGEYVRERARQLAKLGYTGFALDMYGDGKRAEHPDDAKAFMQAVQSDMDAAEARFRTAMERLKDHATVDPERIAAQGYCFGGGMVLAMARRGLDLDGVVSFHGSLGTDNRAEPGDIQAAVRVHTGGADEFVPPEQVASLVTEMQQAGVDFALHSYPGVKHSFTNPAADDYAAEFGLPVAYDAQADRRSWEATKAFYRELFAGPR